VLMQFRLRNPNSTRTNFEHVCNMNNHFKDHINFPNSDHYVLGHCQLFPVEK
jgi:hypothetical protein